MEGLLEHTVWEVREGCLDKVGFIVKPDASPGARADGFRTHSGADKSVHIEFYWSSIA